MNIPLAARGDQDARRKSITRDSPTPLIRKLGLREGTRWHCVRPPEGFELAPLPAGSRRLARPAADLDLILVFAHRAAELRRQVERLIRYLAPDGMLWVAWPKKASKVPTDLSFDVVQRIGLEAGLVDTKICAMDTTFSGLKFVYRLSDRGAATRSAD